MKELIGETVVSQEIRDQGDVIVFKCASGRILIYKCESECCSNTWFDSIGPLPQLLNKKVVDVRDIDLPNRTTVLCPQEEWCDRHHEKHETVKYYGIEICTTEGRCVVEFRNNSSGYYAGSCFLRYDSDKSYRKAIADMYMSLGD